MRNGIDNHYRFRYKLDQAGASVFAGLVGDDSWQKKYFDPNDAASKDNGVWFPET